MITECKNNALIISTPNLFYNHNVITLHCGSSKPMISWNMLITIKPASHNEKQLLDVTILLEHVMHHMHR